MKYFAVFTLIFFLPTICVAEEYDIDWYYKTCVRTKVDNILNGRTGKLYGTATVIAEDETNYYLLTCGHCVKGKNVGVQYLTKNGTYSNLLYISILYSIDNAQSDYAIARLNKKLVNGKLNVVPMSKEVLAEKGDVIIGCGFPRGYWPQFWKSKITVVDPVGTFETRTPFCSGQSGSAVIKLHKGKPYVIGIVAWRGANNDFGRAVDIRQLIKNPSIKASNSNLLKTSVEICVRTGCGKSKNDHYIAIHKITGEPYTGLVGNDIELFCYPRSNRSSINRDYNFIRFGEFLERNKPEEEVPPRKEGVPPIIWDGKEEENPKEEKPPVEVEKKDKEEVPKKLETTTTTTKENSDENFFSKWSRRVGFGVTLAGLIGSETGIGGIAWYLGRRYLRKKIGGKVGDIVADRFPDNRQNIPT